MPHPAAGPLVLPVLGIPVRFHADDPRLRAAARRAFGRWRALDEALTVPESAESGPTIRLLFDPAAREERSEVRSAVSTMPLETGRPATPATTIRTPRPGALVLTAPGIEARADAGRNEATVEVAEPALADEDILRHALDTVVLFLLTRLDRQPVHGAAVARDGAGVVLAGASGVGKSTLAYAAWLDGFQVLSDDAVYVQLDPAVRVWGMGRPAHLRADTVAWFPEIVRAPLRERPSVDRKRALPVHDDARDEELAPPLMVQRTALCLLERGAGPTRAEAVDPDVLVTRLASSLDPGFDVFRDTIRPRLSALARGGAWRLVIGGPPREAIPILREILPDSTG